METLSTEELLSKLKLEDDIIRKARLIELLYRDKALSFKEISANIGRHPSYISHIIRLLKIPQLVVDGYYSGSVSATHLLIISRLQNEQQIIEAYEEILKNDLTAGQAEMLIRQLKFDVNSDDHLTSPKQLNLKAKKLQNQLEGRVRILQSRVRAKIIIEHRGTTLETTEFIDKIVDALRNDDSAITEPISVLE